MSVKSTSAVKATSSPRIEHLASNVATLATPSPTKHTNKPRSCNRFSLVNTLPFLKATKVDLAHCINSSVSPNPISAASRAGLTSPIKDNLCKSNNPALHQPPRPSFDFGSALRQTAWTFRHQVDCNSDALCMRLAVLGRSYNLHTHRWILHCILCICVMRYHVLFRYRPTRPCTCCFAPATTSSSRIFPDTSHDPIVPMRPCPKALPPTSRNIPGKAHNPDKLFFVRA